MRVEVVTPEDYMGDVIGDLNSRRGQVGSTLNLEVMLLQFHATVPLS